MGLEFNFNQWWEAQLVSKPIGNINAYLKGPQRELRLQKDLHCLPIWYNDTSPFRIAPRKIHIAFPPLQQVITALGSLSKGAFLTWVFTYIL